MTIKVEYVLQQDEASASAGLQTAITPYSCTLFGHNRTEVLKIVPEVKAPSLSNTRNLIEVASTIIKEGLSKRDAETIG